MVFEHPLGFCTAPKDYVSITMRERAIDESKLSPSLNSSSSPMDESSGSTDTLLYPASSPSLSWSDSNNGLASINPSPIVSCLLSPSCSPQVLSESQTCTPVPPTVDQQTPQVSCSTPIEHSTPTSSRAAVENPLVRAGLVLQHLMDIFQTICADQVSKQTSRHITGVRVLTSNEYVEMMKEKKRKQKEVEELKQKWKEKRELRKIERIKESERKVKEWQENKMKKEKGKKR